MTWRTPYTNETPVDFGGGFLSPVDIFIPNYIEIPTGEPEFHSFYIQVAVLDPATEMGTRAQQPYTLAWLRENLKSPQDLLDFLHQEVTRLILATIVHLEVGDDRPLNIQTFFYASGEPVVGLQSQIRNCGVVDWTGHLPLPLN